MKVVATGVSVSPRPVPTSHLVLSRSSPWREFAEDIEGVTRTPLCSSFLYFFFLFFSSPQEIWRVGEKHKNHHIKHAALSCSPECLNQAPTRPQPFSNCTIMPYANNSYFLDKPVDPHALCKPPKKCTTKPTLKSKSKKNSLNRMRAAVDSWLQTTAALHRSLWFGVLSDWQLGVKKYYVTPWYQGATTVIKFAARYTAVRCTAPVKVRLVWHLFGISRDDDGWSSKNLACLCRLF